MWRDCWRDPLDEDLCQLDADLARVGLDTGVLVVFHRRASAPPLEARVHHASAETRGGRAERVLRA